MKTCSSTSLSTVATKRQCFKAPYYHYQNKQCLKKTTTIKCQEDINNKHQLSLVNYSKYLFMRSLSCFKPKDPFKLWSKELDKRVATWAKDFDQSFKLLLLGSAGAGKTTILKQIKIIHFEGFSEEERRQKAKEIRTNLLESVRELTGCVTSSGKQIKWENPENQARLEFINNLNLDDQTYELYANKIYDYSKQILNDKGVRDIYEQLNQLSITHRSKYLLNRVDEIRSSNYLPNNDDILQSRRRTSDIQKVEFQVKLKQNSSSSITSPSSTSHQNLCLKQESSKRKGVAHKGSSSTTTNEAITGAASGEVTQTFCMFDVGGQKGERRKWIQVFDGVTAVLFLIDSAAFDTIDEESGHNKLRESLKLFHEVWSTRFLLSSNFVLLFNKQDILREKIARGVKLVDYFPEFAHYTLRSSDKFAPKGQSKKKYTTNKQTIDNNSLLDTNLHAADKLSLFRANTKRSSRFSLASTLTLTSTQTANYHRPSKSFNPTLSESFKQVPATTTNNNALRAQRPMSMYETDLGIGHAAADCDNEMYNDNCTNTGVVKQRSLSCNLDKNCKHHQTYQHHHNNHRHSRHKSSMSATSSSSSSSNIKHHNDALLLCKDTTNKPQICLVTPATPPITSTNQQQKQLCQVLRAGERETETKIELEAGTTNTKDEKSDSKRRSSSRHKSLSLASQDEVGKNKNKNKVKTSTSSKCELQAVEQESSDEAYYRARAFIRDKFLQIANQSHTDYIAQTATVPATSTQQQKFTSSQRPTSARSTSTTTTRGFQIDHPRRIVHYHYTTATDTQNIRELFEVLQSMMLKSMRKSKS